ncbi:nuclear transport factor 2 family protein [Nonomuraea sp. NPDC050153]|uniref:nuclear transport factor 2 family protein n=1 Tax=Nonomuraea sp. NPDC050153 TaxID=3364359 RepID=UPI00378954D9
MSSQEQVLDLVRRWARAELDGDADAFGDLLGEDFAGIGPVGFKLDKQQWADRHRGDLKNHHFEILDPRVRLHDDVAIVHGVQEQRTSVRGHEVNDLFRVTLVAVRQGECWVIANLQLSGPLQDLSALPPFARPRG